MSIPWRHTWLEATWVNGVGRILCPIKLLVTGDLPSPFEPAIFICNHQVDAGQAPAASRSV